MGKSAISRRSREAKDWLHSACFPYWARHGVSEHNIFAEVLGFNHNILDHEATRIRVQARQTYVFAEAFRMGWEPDVAKNLVQLGVNTLLDRCMTTTGLPGVLLKSDGSSLVDDSVALYDVAFVLYALSEAFDVLSTDRIRDAAQGILDATVKQLKDVEYGGFIETSPRKNEVRHQNPHMHLFEALLSIQKTGLISGTETYSSEILGLFLTRFTAGPGGLLGEHFAKDWGEPDGADAVNIEPGHQFEWVWLLWEHAKRQNHPLPPEALRLYTFGCATLDDDGRACHVLTRSGSIVDGSRRTWTQTEALKAHLAMFEATGDDAYLDHAARSFDCLIDEYLTLEGGWVDRFDADGAPVAPNIPASTGYHVVLAFSELIRVAEALARD